MIMGQCCALVLLAGVFLGPQISLGALNLCRNVDGFVIPEDGENSFLAYNYATDSGDGSCASVQLLCNASIPTSALSQKSWFISDVKEYYGTDYKAQWIQLYKVQCPAKHALHLFPQLLSVERSAASTDCTVNDFVSVDIGRDGPITICGSDNTNGNPLSNTNNLYRFGAGELVEQGNATIEFCTDDSTVGPIQESGFVIRATCIDISKTNLPGCVDYQFFEDWDFKFVNKINDDRQSPEKIIIPHKRSAELKDIAQYRRTNIVEPSRANLNRIKKMRSGGSVRKKRAIDDIFLSQNQTVTYTNRTVEIDFKNGTRSTFRTNRLVTSNEQIGTREFFGDANMVFGGPARVEFGSQFIFVIDYSFYPSLDAVILPSLKVSNIINSLAEYLYNFYVRPYPIIEETSGVLPTVETFPLPNATLTRGIRYVPERNIQFVKEDINSGTCRRAVVVNRAPKQGSEAEANILSFCKFFSLACNPLLNAMCRQIAELDLIPK